MTCPICDDKRTTECLEIEEFHYGDNSVPLIAQVPVCECLVCGSKWTDWRAELIREKSVKQYLGANNA
jgi:hypothetical protein